MVRGILLCGLLAGCLEAPPDSTEPDSGDAFDVSADVTSTCSEAADTYTPFHTSGSPSGPVATYPWRGTTSSYPNGDVGWASVESDHALRVVRVARCQ